MFSSQEELIADAYHRQGERIAYDKSEESDAMSVRDGAA